MEKFGNLYKQNGLLKLKEKRNNDFALMRKSKRSAIFECHRDFGNCNEDSYNLDTTPRTPLLKNGFPKVNAKASKPSAKENKLRPFVVGIVRHKIHSPPFLNANVDSPSREIKKKTFKSLAPKNYKFKPPVGLKLPFTPQKIKKINSPFRDISNKKNVKENITRPKVLQISENTMFQDSIFLAKKKEAGKNILDYFKENKPVESFEDSPPIFGRSRILEKKANAAINSNASDAATKASPEVKSKHVNFLDGKKKIRFSQENFDVFSEVNAFDELEKSEISVKTTIMDNNDKKRYGIRDKFEKSWESSRSTDDDLSLNPSMNEAFADSAEESGLFTDSDRVDDFTLGSVSENITLLLTKSFKKDFPSKVVEIDEMPTISAETSDFIYNDDFEVKVPNSCCNVSTKSAEQNQDFFQTMDRKTSEELSLRLSIEAKNDSIYDAEAKKIEISDRNVSTVLSTTNSSLNNDQLRGVEAADSSDDSIDDAETNKIENTDKNISKALSNTSSSQNNDHVKGVETADSSDDSIDDAETNKIENSDRNVSTVLSTTNSSLNNDQLRGVEAADSSDDSIDDAETNKIENTDKNISKALSNTSSSQNNDHVKGVETADSSDDSIDDAETNKIENSDRNVSTVLSTTNSSLNNDQLRRVEAADSSDDSIDDAETNKIENTDKNISNALSNTSSSQNNDHVKGVKTADSSDDSIYDAETNKIENTDKNISNALSNTSSSLKNYQLKDVETADSSDDSIYDAETNKIENTDKNISNALSNTSSSLKNDHLKSVESITKHNSISVIISNCEEEMVQLSIDNSENENLDDIFIREDSASEANLSNSCMDKTKLLSNDDFLNSFSAKNVFSDSTSDENNGNNLVTSFASRVNESFKNRAEEIAEKSIRNDSASEANLSKSSLDKTKALLNDSITNSFSSDKGYDTNSSKTSDSNKEELFEDGNHDISKNISLGSASSEEKETKLVTSFISKVNDSLKNSAEKSVRKNSLSEADLSNSSLDETKSLSNDGTSNSFSADEGHNTISSEINDLSTDECNEDKNLDVSKNLSLCSARKSSTSLKKNNDEELNTEKSFVQMVNDSLKNLSNYFVDKSIRKNSISEDNLSKSSLDKTKSLLNDGASTSFSADVGHNTISSEINDLSTDGCNEDKNLDVSKNLSLCSARKSSTSLKENNDEELNTEKSFVQIINDSLKNLVEETTEKPLNNSITEADITKRSSDKRKPLSYDGGSNSFGADKGYDRIPTESNGLAEENNSKETKSTSNLEPLSADISQDSDIQIIEDINDKSVEIEEVLITSILETSEDGACQARNQSKFVGKIKSELPIEKLKSEYELPMKNTSKTSSFGSPSASSIFQKYLADKSFSSLESVNLPNSPMVDCKSPSLKNIKKRFLFLEKEVVNISDSEDEGQSLPSHESTSQKASSPSTPQIQVPKTNVAVDRINVPIINVSPCQNLESKDEKIRVSEIIPLPCPTSQPEEKKTNVPKINVSPCQNLESEDEKTRVSEIMPLPCPTSQTKEEKTNVPVVQFSTCQSPKSQPLSCPSSETPCTPLKSFETAAENLKMSMVENEPVYSLRTRQISVTPSPKRVPKKIQKKMTPFKIPPSEVFIENSSNEIASPIRVMSLRGRAVNVSPSPKKTPKTKLIERMPEICPPELVIEKPQESLEVDTPARVMSLRSRTVNVSPSPLKKTPRARKAKKN